MDKKYMSFKAYGDDFVGRYEEPWYVSLRDLDNWVPCIFLPLAPFVVLGYLISVIMHYILYKSGRSDALASIKAEEQQILSSTITVPVENSLKGYNKDKKWVWINAKTLTVEYKAGMKDGEMFYLLRSIEGNKYLVSHSELIKHIEKTSIFLHLDL